MIVNRLLLPWELLSRKRPQKWSGNFSKPIQYVDSQWPKIQSRTWLCPIQVHYWVRQPGKKSVAASVKSKSSMGQPRTENSRAVINFSPHCSHTTCNGVSWGNRQSPFALIQDDHWGLWVQPLNIQSHTLHEPCRYTESQTGGLRPQSESLFEEVWEEERSEHLTHKLPVRFKLHTEWLTVTVPLTAPKCEMVVFLILVLCFHTLLV